MPSILYIGQTPAEGTGSPVIVMRHLQRLAAAGWRIAVIAEHGQDTTACRSAGWKVDTLPLRRVWWPPYRSDWDCSRSLRTWLLGGECLRLHAGTRPDAVLGYLAAHNDFYPQVAASCARRCGAPLTLLVHDDATAFTDDPREKFRLRQRHARLLACAHQCCFVSRELAALHGPHSGRNRVLPPIPGTWPHFAGWHPTKALQPRVYYAGFIWPAQFPLLRRIALALSEAGVHLVLLTRDTPELRVFLRGGAAGQHVPPFATNHEALAHLAHNAAGLLVSYAESVSEMPWVATSFPSKLVEQAQLGLPCAIVAPSHSAVARWAGRNHYEDCFPPSDLAGLTAWARDLRAEGSWTRHALPVRELAAGEFNPESIQAAFAAGLLRK